MEKIIARSNESRWHQCGGGSQLLEPYLTTCLLDNGEGPVIEDILNGTFQISPDTSIATTDFIQACKQPNNIELIPDKSCIRARYSITMKSLNKQIELTCTYIQHVGHYQVITRYKAIS